MRVIGAGWGRTGTTSAAAALEQLGFGPCFQMQDVWSRPGLAALWNRHRAGRPVDWRAELGSIHQWTAPGRDVGPPEVAALLAAVWDEHFGGWEGFLDRERAVAAYDAHVDDVRRTCPAHRLVEWRVSDGWESLCSALDVPVPEQPVPHLNARSG